MVVFLGVDRRQDPGELLTPGSSSEDFFDLCERLFRTRGFLILGEARRWGESVRKERKKTKMLIGKHGVQFPQLSFGKPEWLVITTEQLRYDPNV